MAAIWAMVLFQSIRPRAMQRSTSQIFRQTRPMAARKSSTLEIRRLGSSSRREAGVAIDSIIYAGRTHQHVSAESGKTSRYSQDTGASANCTTVLQWLYLGIRFLTT